MIVIPGRSLTGAGFPAARSGYDSYFMTCGEFCAKRLKAALEREIASGGIRLGQPVGEDGAEAEFVGEPVVVRNR